MLTRRAFLPFLAMPAIVRASSLDFIPRATKLEAWQDEVVDWLSCERDYGNTILSPRLIAREAQRILNHQMTLTMGRLRDHDLTISGE